MSNITDEFEKLSGIMSKLGEAHNMLAKTSLSKEEYQQISGLLAKAKDELFNFYNEHKAAALQNKVSDEEPNKDDIIKEAKRLWNIPNKVEAVKLVMKLGYSLKDAKAYCEDNFDRKVSDISAEEWKVFSHTSALGNTGDYMSDCGIENGTISFYCDKPDDITNEELQEICDNLNASLVNERKDNVALIEKSRIEGILTGLKICKEMWAQGTISHENIYENEVYYKDELKNIVK